ncbi:SbcC/MukB-like Walker B domain-containing protein [Novispirillum itersonii]|uniref:SbcC/MukB-like Walker B domain-containing protein n=1 Tax=Novispirillum itersonii TaxID=189 RepID=UPI00035F17F1|nr:SbcC/MukB-like Walker B domain-containing protein [Novispirillum itersonii]
MPLYKATRFSAFNWYLVSAKDVDIRDATAFIGPTGSGKSSIEDGIQTVVCGGSHRHIHTNASASGKSGRKIIDYCLGYTIPKSDGGVPLRSQCETVLSVVFSAQHADGSVHHVSVGLALSARAEDSREVVLSRFIAPGYQFSVEDFKEQRDDGIYVMRWDDLEKELKRRCPAVRFYRNTAEKFVADMLAEMRTHGRQPDTRHFLHTFSNAVAFRPIFDPTQFVRSYILEPDPLDIERVRESILRWRSLAETVRLIEEKLKRIASVRAKYAEWGNLVIGRAMDQWGQACVRVDKSKKELRRLCGQMSAASAEMIRVEEAQKRLERELAAAGSERDRLKAMLNDSGISGRLQQLEADRKILALRLAPVQAQDKTIRDLLRAAATLEAVSEFLPASARGAVAAAASAASLLGKPGLGWLIEHAGAVADSLAKLRPLADLPSRLEPMVADRQAGLVDLRRQREALEENIARAAEGARPLSSHTVAFLRLLRAEDIDATVFCDVVDVTDADWQFAAESLLGLFREAVIVAPRHLTRANEILYANRNAQGLHKIRLVKTNRTDSAETDLDSDSLGAVLKTDNPHAQALICTHLGGVKRVETIADLNRAHRAIMRDGRATSGLAFSVNQDIVHILGRQDASVVQTLRDGLDRLAADTSRLTAEIALLRQAQRFGETVATLDLDPRAAAETYDEIRRGESEIERRRQAVMSDEETALITEIDAITNEIRQRRAEVEDAKEAWKKAVAAKSKAEAAVERKREQMRLEVGLMRRAANGFAARNEDLRTALQWAGDSAPPYFETRPHRGWPGDGFPARHDAFIADCATRLDHIDDRISRAGLLARRMLDDYLRDYGIERPMADDSPYRVDYNWVVLQHSKLQQNELREHRVRAEEAEREMYFTLKEDLLVNLNGRFQKLDIQLRSLNAQLRRHKFTGQFYSFRKKADPRFDRLRRLAIEVGSNPDKAQSIVANRSGDLVMQAAISELNEYLENTGGEGTEDYRNYFTFDLYMHPANTEPDESIEIDDSEVRKKGLISLSGRATVGSGGEGQAPFYVAIAASMALAYYPGGHPHGEPSGMGLVLFDEAFNKLDIVTTQSLIQFFKDLGLQLILAAPEDKRPTFTEVLDCIVSVNRDPVRQEVYLDSEYPSDYARQQIAAINPDHIGLDGFRARMEAVASG